MRYNERGWRSARGDSGVPAVRPTGGMRGGLAIAARTAPSVPAPVAAAPARPGAPNGASPSASSWSTIQALAGETLTKWPWQGVNWNLSYVAFLVYCAVVISYVVPVAQPAMIVALIALPFSGVPIRFPLPFLLFTAYVAIAFLSTISTPYPDVASVEIQKLFKTWAIAFVAIQVLTDRSRIRFFFFWILGLNGLWPVRGAMFNHFVHHADVQGRIAWNNAYANPNDLAALLLLPLGLAASVLFVERTKLVRFSAVLGCTLIPLVTFLTQSRGAILSLALFVVAIVIRQKNRLRLIVMLAGASVVIGFFAPKSVWSRLGSLVAATQSGDLKAADDQGSARQRYELWKVAKRIAIENPITGVGFGAYERAHLEYARRPEFDKTARGMRAAHNTYLTVAAETGLIGFGLWSLMVLSVLMLAARARKLLKGTRPTRERELFYVTMAFYAYLLAGVFGSFQEIVNTYLHVMIIWALADIAIREYTASQEPSRPRLA
jgi:O-antigen ligase